jgi:hypothetical protein
MPLRGVNRMYLLWQLSDALAYYARNEKTRAKYSLRSIESSLNQWAWKYKMHTVEDVSMCGIAKALSVYPKMSF